MASERKIPRVARTFKFPPDLIERYEAQAAKLGMNRTAFVERAIEAALGGPVADEGPVVAAARAVGGAEAAPTAPRPSAVPVNRADAFRAARRRP